MDQPLFMRPGLRLTRETFGDSPAKCVSQDLEIES